MKSYSAMLTDGLAERISDQSFSEIKEEILAKGGSNVNYLPEIGILTFDCLSEIVLTHPGVAMIVESRNDYTTQS